MRSALILSTLLAASGGCANTSKTIKTPTVDTSAQIKNFQQPKESRLLETKVIETVARRIRERCGDFPAIGLGESGGVVMSNPDGSDANADAMILFDVPPDAATLECIVRASMDRALPKLCIPVTRQYGLGDANKLNLSIDCRSDYERGSR